MQLRCAGPRETRKERSRECVNTADDSSASTMRLVCFCYKPVGAASARRRPTVEKGIAVPPAHAGAKGTCGQFIGAVRQLTAPAIVR